LATTHDCFIFLAIKIPRTCGRAFISQFLHKIVADALADACFLRVGKLGQGFDFPVFSANRSSAVQGIAVICAPYH
jgi:hypothetical protein